MENYLVITALGEDRQGIVNQISGLVMDSGCSIYDSRMTVLGGEFAVILMASGKWNQLTRLEDILSTQAEALGLIITCKRTQTGLAGTQRVPYSIEAFSVDQPGIVHRVANFLSDRQINIQEMQSTRYAAAHTGTSMFAMQILVSIPTDIHIVGLRDEFLDFCESLNIDATLEPVKP